ncbi:MAG: D-amino acid dehydrogenase small subunit [Gammaproteobacteria bacterium]|nr:D-amino acid dehydrogenase small subunit [Gammaproteobacteria bacterium]
MKVIIIGAGLIGVSTAYFLSRQGHEVAVFDRREAAGMDTSFANGGMLTPSQSEPWNQPGIFWKALGWLGHENSPFLVRPQALLSMFGWGLSFLRNSNRQRFFRNMQKNARLASYSLQVLRELRQTHALHYDENTNGTIKIFTDKRSFMEIVERAGLYTELGIAYQVLDRTEVLNLEPSLTTLGSAIQGGIYYPDDESGDAHKFCQSLAQQAQQQGVQFHNQVEVEGFEYTPNHVTSITTSTGSYTADVYVLAAGSYSTLLAKTVGLNLPVRPIKGYSLTIDISGRGQDSGPRIPVVDESMHIAMVPLGSRLRVAGTAELSGYDLKLRQSRIENMYRHVTWIYPDLVKARDGGSILEWTGLRPYTSDGVPVIGKTPFENLYLNTGHGHLGWSMAAGSGKLVSDMICGSPPALNPAPYRLGR